MHINNSNYRVLYYSLYAYLKKILFPNYEKFPLSIMSNKTIFTCVTCNIAYNDADLQRDHYKTDWHRYNLKRKVAELPPIPYEAFQEKLEQQKVQVSLVESY